MTADDTADTGARPATHGTTVSAAAKDDTPAGFDKHGAWVSSVARHNHGQGEGREGGQDALGRTHQYPTWCL